jgi:hypothetical protein
MIQAAFFMAISASAESLEFLNVYRGLVSSFGRLQFAI